tara:strand:- start:456 stop:806 length:351 start_codon:yes stop_codon:yes gene_type:complete
MVLFLFAGLIASGINARVTLLSHRGGFFVGEQNAKTNGMVMFDLVRQAAGIAVFLASFFFFPWWQPLAALALGYWLIAPMVVTPSSFGFFHSTRVMTDLASLVCSIILGYYFFTLI